MHRWLALPLVALAGLASAAEAGDLTGTWKGRFSCTVQDGQTRQKISSRSVTAPEAGVSTLEVSQPDGPGSSALQVEIDDVLFAGFVRPASEAQSGIGALFDCSATGDPGDAGEIRAFRWKVSADSIRGTISWRSLRVDDDAQVATCKGSWRRVSREDPGISPCR